MVMDYVQEEDGDIIGGDVADYELTHHVREALKFVLLGDMDEYDQLIRNMHNNVHLVPDEVAMLVTILRALSGAVSYIDVVHHRALLSSKVLGHQDARESESKMRPIILSFGRLNNGSHG
ncbi:hypothetical protein Tco_1092280 [Tanacetum coccineum]|uniref:Uncharacterized protein n=1 Tax=Tanacetum coccineum TaxID=301880 RepID=A0ABQ5IBD7_9ASTR